MKPGGHVAEDECRFARVGTVDVAVAGAHGGEADEGGRALEGVLGLAQASGAERVGEVVVAGRCE